MLGRFGLVSFPLLPFLNPADAVNLEQKVRKQYRSEMLQLQGADLRAFEEHVSEIRRGCVTHKKRLGGGSFLISGIFLGLAA